MLTEKELEKLAQKFYDKLAGKPDLETFIKSLVMKDLVKNVIKAYFKLLEQKDYEIRLVKKTKSKNPFVK